MYYSRQRQWIWEAVAADGGHPTAEEVFRRLKPAHPALSLGTVYRNLRQLEQGGRLRRVELPEGPVRFDSRLDPHEHLICERCGRVEDITVAFSPSLESQVRAATPLPVTGCRLVVYGLCRRCSLTQADPENFT